MSVLVFSGWNWEFDRVEGSVLDLSVFDNVYRPHALVRLTPCGFVYRVEIFEMLYDSDEVCNKRRYIYDYFCFDDGRVKEKRSLDTLGNVSTIVRYDFDKCAGMVEQLAWSPEATKDWKVKQLPDSPECYRLVIQMSGGKTKVSGTK